jgi:hypothetical protein
MGPTATSRGAYTFAFYALKPVPNYGADATDGDRAAQAGGAE